MSCMWVSVADCNQSHIFQLTQLLRQDKELQIILSYGAPYADNSTTANILASCYGEIDRHNDFF